MAQISYTDFYTTMFVSILIAAFLMTLTVLAIVTFRDTARGQQWLRDHYGRRLAGTRMWNMLEHRQVSPLAYVDNTSIGGLREQIRTCEQCQKHELCDETLGYVGHRHRNYGFCPNRRAIDAVAKTPSH